MTSIAFFPPQPKQTLVPPEWGTGRFSSERKGSDLWTPKPATWFQTGKPVEQYYDLTQLKRSNVRWNDQLLSKPQEGDMTKLIINKPFPAEHPFSSHTSRHAVFPSFSESPEDPKRGVEARREKPINAECPASAYDVKIVSKTKGFGLREEIQSLPHQGQKKGLHWKGEDFSQLVKSHGGKKEYYPTPIKTVVPNLETRHAGQGPVTEKTANALRNVEKDQWQTTYDLSHTGLGPSNPKKLDNYGDKSYTKASTGVDDDVLYPRSINTFDPPRPHQGRIAREITPKVPEQDAFKRPANTAYRRKLTLDEREEHRLLNGTEYKSFPEVDRRPHDTQWNALNTNAHPGNHLQSLEVTKSLFPADVVPYQNATPPTEDEKQKQAKLLAEERQKHHDKHQQIETENRWKVLESHKPHHDITALQKKYESLNNAEDKPSTFYKHEGKFQAERAGLYQTSYNPYSLAQQMNREQESAYRTMDTSMSHQEALHRPTELNWEMDEALLHSKTETLRPTYTFSDRPPANDILEPFQFDTEMQRRHLQPVASNAGIKNQEGELVLTESTMGASYNTPRFLQENDITFYARNEPNELMSHKNKNLKKVRTLSRGKTVQFNDNVTVATMSEGTTPSKVGRSHISSPKRELFEQPASDPILPHTKLPDSPLKQELSSSNVNVNTTQYVSTHAQYVPDKDLKNTTYEPSFNQPLGLTRSNTEPNLSMSNKFDTSQLRASTPTSSQFFGKQPTIYRSEFSNKTSNVVPTGMKTGSMMFQTSYHTQFPGATLDLSYKKDEKFNWEPGCGVPRPQTSLTKIQDNFTKSDARRRFHVQFPETNPDLRQNIVFGKKHSFGGMNAQILRGTPVVD